jgi:hypothetical protein
MMFFSLRPSLREEGDGNLVFEEGLQGLGGYLYVSEETDLAGLADADFLDDGVFRFDPEDVAGLADGEALGIEVQRAKIVSGGEQTTWLRRRAILGGGLEFEASPGFVGQADADQRATRALGAILQGRGNGTGFGQGAGLGEGLKGFVDECLVDRDSDALLGFDVIEDGLIAGISVVA